MLIKGGRQGLSFLVHSKAVIIHANISAADWLRAHQLIPDSTES